MSITNLNTAGNAVRIDGVTELLDLLENVGPRHARNLMRSTTHSVAGIIAKGAKSNAPHDTGTLKSAIKTKRRKSAPTAPVSDVIVEHGNDVKNDAFYWRFLEYGTQKGLPGSHSSSETRFIGRATDVVRADFVNIYTQEFGKKLEAALRREARRNGVS